MLIYLVRNHIHLRMLCQHICQCLQFRFTIHTTSRIGGRADNNSLRFVRYCTSQLFGIYFKILFNTRTHHHRSPLRQLHHLGIAHPIGSGNDYLIASIHHRQYYIANRLLSPIRTHNLVGRIGQTILFFQFLANSFPQVEIARNRRIKSKIIVYCLFGSLLYVVGCSKIGFAHTQVDYIHPLRFQFSAFLRHY